ncbi:MULTISPECIES: pentapeptide repeat-containing protein [Cyanophyceae]|uniref:Pentapeptide repeat-containing protein n=1 Tax=Leptolyngbya subtilissima DQ-A4 TaxID=2933933 RepID=A0ABV0KC19_9CYAN|nr:pentapeptide repeat-containing protein [Nodosilinea sp. FACHB-141]MBD2115259.1 pentapeptide repeat-containing protein [Nodosilinea sp. FACHB-141]
MPRKPDAEKQRADTERVAWEIYASRCKPGARLNKDKLWKEAEQIVRSPIRTALFVSNRPLLKLREPTKQAFKFLGWDTPKWFLFSLPQLEWMKLLAVPLVVAAAGSIITGQIQGEANQIAVLKAYFDKLEELTFSQNLLSETPNEGAIVLARGRTVAALRELDLSRRTQLIDFIQASGLSQIKEDSATPVISFKAQNLSRLDLRGVNLSGLDFQEANLIEANLVGASLDKANLAGAYLGEANLAGAYLGEANLVGASLKKANLVGAYLFEAKLDGADLVGANLTGAYMGRIKNGAYELDQLDLAQLCGTTLPGGIITPYSNRDCEELGIDPETGEAIGF